MVSRFFLFLFFYHSAASLSIHYTFHKNCLLTLERHTFVHNLSAQFLEDVAMAMRSRILPPHVPFILAYFLPLLSKGHLPEMLSELESTLSASCIWFNLSPVSVASCKVFHGYLRTASLKEGWRRLITTA